MTHFIEFDTYLSLDIGIIRKAYKWARRQSIFLKSKRSRSSLAANFGRTSLHNDVPNTKIQYFLGSIIITFNSFDSFANRAPQSDSQVPQLVFGSRLIY